MAEPLLRNAFALVLNAAATSMLGVAGWIVTTHRYDVEHVGRSSALLSVVLLLSGIAQLNLEGALPRFLPRSGSRGRRLVLSCYATATAFGIAATIAAIFVLSGSTSVEWFLEGGLGAACWFVAAVVVWSLFNLADAVLIGLRRSVLVPAKNTLFGGLKIACLVVLAAVSPRLGIFGSWTIAMGFTVVAVNVLLFRRLIPRHAADSAVPAERFASRVIRNFVVFDYLAALCTLVAWGLAPVIVAQRLGAEANAYFYVVWIVAGVLEVALVRVGASLTAEGAHDEGRLPELTKMLTTGVVAVGLPIAVALVIAAPYFLSAFGRIYSVEATGLLRLIAISMLPRSLVVLWCSVARVKRTVARIFVVQCAFCVLFLTLSVHLLDHLGIAGVGVALLISQFALAAAVLPSLVRLLRASGRSRQAEPFTTVKAISDRECPASRFAPP